MEGPYNEAFLEKLQKCPTEDDGSVEYAVAKVSPKASRRVSPGRVSPPCGGLLETVSLLPVFPSGPPVPRRHDGQGLLHHGRSGAQK